MVLLKDSTRSACLVLIESDGEVLGEFPIPPDQLEQERVTGEFHFSLYGTPVIPEPRPTLSRMNLSYHQGRIFWRDYRGHVYEVKLLEKGAEVKYIGLTMESDDDNLMLIDGVLHSMPGRLTKAIHLGYQSGWGVLTLDRRNSKIADGDTSPYDQVWLTDIHGGERRPLWRLDLVAGEVPHDAYMLKEGHIAAMLEVARPSASDDENDPDEYSCLVDELRLYQPPLWSPSTHHWFPPQHRATVRNLFMLWRASSVRPLWLPRELIVTIASLLPMQLSLS